MGWLGFKFLKGVFKSVKIGIFLYFLNEVKMVKF